MPNFRLFYLVAAAGFAMAILSGCRGGLNDESAASAPAPAATDVVQPAPPHVPSS